MRISGWDDDSSANSQFTVFLSTSEKYPDEANCQCAFKNERRIDFRLASNGKAAGEPGGGDQHKFSKQTLYVCLEHSHDAQIRVSVQFGADSASQRAAAEVSEE